MSDCEFCSLPLEEHERVEGGPLDGLLVHVWPVAPRTWDELQRRLRDDGGSGG